MLTYSNQSTNFHFKKKEKLNVFVTLWGHLLPFNCTLSMPSLVKEPLDRFWSSSKKKCKSSLEERKKNVLHSFFLSSLSTLHRSSSFLLKYRESFFASQSSLRNERERENFQKKVVTESLQMCVFLDCWQGHGTLKRNSFVINDIALRKCSKRMHSAQQNFAKKLNLDIPLCNFDIPLCNFDIQLCNFTM